MTKRAPSTQAQAAKLIRAELKKHGIAARVTSSSASMMTEVTVRLVDPTPEAARRIGAFVAGFQYGHFDGMDDSYHYSNKRPDLPQVKFASVETSFSDELRDEAVSWNAAYWSNWDEMREVDQDYRVWQTLQNPGPFWTARKPRQLAA